MWTSSGARAFASESRTRRFSFRRACEWSLARHGAQGRGGSGKWAQNLGRESQEGARSAGWCPGGGPGRRGGGGTREGEGAARRRIPTTGPCGMLYWRSTAASSASERTA